MFERNKFTVTTLRNIKDNIVNNKKPNYNPTSLIGMNRIKRYEVFFRIFDKEFKSQYRNIMMYVNSDEIDLDKVREKKLIIIEELELLINNKDVQSKLQELINMCLKEDKQLILCSSTEIKELEIDEILKSKMMYGLQLYLES